MNVYKSDEKSDFKSDIYKFYSPSRSLIRNHRMKMKIYDRYKLKNPHKVFIHRVQNVPCTIFFLNWIRDDMMIWRQEHARAYIS
jgi:hypothetical protein